MQWTVNSGQRAVADVSVVTRELTVVPAHRPLPTAH
jgi:hypothetical protein